MRHSLTRCLVTAAVLAFAADLPNVQAACKSSVADVNGDGLKEVVLENDLIRVVVCPEKGGLITGLSSKDGRLDEQAFRYGLLDTLDWSRNFGDNQVFSKVPYAWMLEKNTPEEIVLHQYRQGTGESQYLTLHTRIRIRDGASSVRCSYEVANAAEAMGRAVVRLWNHSWMRPKSGEAVCYLSQAAGVDAEVYAADKGAGRKCLSAEQAPRGWMAMKAGGENVESAGAAFAMDWRYLQWMYFWFSKSDVSPEWRYIPIQLDNGKSFASEFIISPFAGLARVDHAEDGLVFDTGLETAPVPCGARKLRIAFDRPRTVHVQVNVRPVGKSGDEPPFPFQPLGETTVSRNALQVAEVPYELKGLAEGDYVLQCLVTEGGRTNANFERKFDIGKAFAKSTYVYRPVDRKVEVTLARQKTYFPYTPSPEVVTPHFDWYHPNAGGRARVLYLGNYAESREVVDLAQVLDMDCVSPCITPGDWSAIGDPLSNTVGNPDLLECLKRLPDYVRPDDAYDAIVIRKLQIGYGKQSDYFWKNMPIEVKTQLVERVRAGAGLVVLDKPSSDWGPLYDLFSEVRLDAGKNPAAVPFPNLQGNQNLAQLVKKTNVVCGVFGQGRVLFDLTGGQAVLDAKGAPLAELVRWAGRKDSPVTLDSIRLAAAKLTWETWTQQQVRVVCTAGRDFGRVTAELNWYSEKPVQDFFKLESDGRPCGYYQPTWEALATRRIACEIQAGTNTFEWPCAAPRAGAGELRLRLLKGDKVLKSATLDFTVPPAVAVEGIRLEKEIVTPGDGVSGMVILSNKGTNEHEVVCTVRGYDVYNREFYRHETPVRLAAGATSSVPLACTVGMPVSVLQLIRADVYEGGRPAAAGLTEFTVPSLKNRFDDYLAFCWGSSSQQGLDVMRDMGFDAYYLYYIGDGKNINATRRAGAHAVLESGLRLFACQCGSDLGFDWQEGERLVRKVSFSDPAYLEKEHQRLGALAALGARYGCYAYNLADEPSLGAWETHSQFDWSEGSLANFRKWLQDRYGTVERLNAEWETAYKSFDEARPAVESEVRDQANLAPWQDFRAHMNHEVARMYRNNRDALLGPDPGVLMGVCGVNDGHPYSGFDWWELAGICDNVNTYTSIAMLRSLTSAGKFNVYQGYKWGYHTLWDNAWRGFFEGWQGYAYWTEGIYLKPDHTLAEAHARPVREILATFRNGTGKLWMETTRQDRDIVLHYSQPSIHAAWMMKYWQKEINDGLLFYRNNRWGTEKAFYDSALDVSYMAYGQLEQGLLAQRRPRAFVLPLSSCMSMKEIEAVRQYVREGGVLIADMACALRDEHGKPYPRGMLDDVFGIERDAGYKNTIALLRGTLSGREGEAALYIEQGVRPASGKAQTRMVCKEKPAGLPLVIVNSFGKGRAIYLGFTGLYNQMRQAKPQLSGLYREVFGGVAGLRGRYRVTAGGDALLPGQTLVHACGDADYFGFYQDLSFVLPPDKTTDDAEEADVKAGARKAQFQLPAARHVYDLLDGRYLGRIDRFDFLSVPGRGRLYAALPYQVKAIDLSLPGRAQAGEVLSLTLSLRKEGTGRALHVYHLEVAGPDGKILPYYTRNLSAPDGMAECKLQFPLNAEPGRYTVTVRDAASGTRAACKVKVVR